ncbi:MAG: hypothetical protein QG608_1822 [Actinomycetota bacterium]|nr:hypothetical protein [Actinomycetota bacterium]
MAVTGKPETATKLSSASETTLFLSRFNHFEDGVITGIQLHLPRTSEHTSGISFDIQAMDDESSNEWRLVRIILLRVYEYLVQEREAAFGMTVLSDGLNCHYSPDKFLLDLDPGPDEWSPHGAYPGGIYGRQYARGTHCYYRVLDGPFI